MTFSSTEQAWKSAPLIAEAKNVGWKLLDLFLVSFKTQNTNERL